MDTILFKAKLAIYFSEYSNDKEIQSSRLAAQQFLQGFCTPLVVEFRSNLFSYHPDQESEQCGFHAYGELVEIERPVRHPQHYYDLAKIFEGLAGILNIQKAFLRCEFDLLK